MGRAEAVSAARFPAIWEGFNVLFELKSRHTSPIDRVDPRASLLEKVAPALVVIPLIIVALSSGLVGGV
jgi:hypothetical protein